MFSTQVPFTSSPFSGSPRSFPLPSPDHSLGFSLPSIRQYELVVHEDMDTAKVYTGEMGRLKSYENQKP